ncbi:MAG: transcription antitermination factor NusB, partial [Clostridia bacterium]|nr:transcription antitermination factor NusB [Clostridia bacterium]
YINDTINGVKEHYDELLSLIAENSKNFKLDRIYKSDLAALLLACYEMKYIEDIPLKVSISEAIELVKIFSTENSNKFVNGVLKGVFNELNKEV